ARVRQNGSRAAPAAGGTGRSAPGNQPARATGTTPGDGLSGARHHAQCPGMWRDVRSPSRTVLSSSLATSSGAQRYGPACRAPAHRLPRYERPGRGEAEPGDVAITVAAMTGPAPKMP